MNVTTVTSKDGSVIDIEVSGSGASVVLVSGGSVDRQSNNGLAEVLSKQFTVYNYDRRGRGASTDVQPYAVTREIEDIDAVIQAAGGSAYLYGTSSGAALALEAAAAGLNVTKLALWEPPYIIEGSRPLPPMDSAKTYRELVAAGRRGDAVEYFMTKVVGLPQEFANDARTQPWWAWQEALAHTLAYDAEVMGNYGISANAGKVKAETLVLAGGADMPWMRDSAQALVQTIPGAQLRFLEGEGHAVNADVLGAALIEFFSK